MTLLKLKPDLKTYLSFCLIKLLLAPCHDCLTHSIEPETSSGVATLIRGGPHPHKSPPTPAHWRLQLHKNAERRPQQLKRGDFCHNSAITVRCLLYVDALLVAVMVWVNLNTHTHVLALHIRSGSLPICWALSLNLFYFKFLFCNTYTFSVKVNTFFVHVCVRVGVYFYFFPWWHCVWVCIQSKKIDQYIYYHLIFQWLIELYNRLFICEVLRLVLCIFFIKSLWYILLVIC